MGNMLLEVAVFKQRVRDDLATLVRDLQDLTGRSGSEEEKAWRESLTKLDHFLDRPAFASLHLYVNGKGVLDLEYQLPGASSWCDVVLLGKHGNQSSAVILELKNWMTRNDSPSTALGLMERMGGLQLHPSDQVQGYTTYCKNFHSAVLDYKAAVHGGVLFTADRDYHAYELAPNASLTDSYPCFSTERHGDEERFLEFCRQRLTEADPKFAEAFEKGSYRQDRGFIKQIGTQINDPLSSPFELLDNQRFAFKVAKAHVESAVFSDRPIRDSKRVIAIIGPPGSGKSVVAAKLWAALAVRDDLPTGDIAFVTTSSSQNGNWSHLFNEMARDAGGAGVVKKATSFCPLSIHALSRLRRIHGSNFCKPRPLWRQHLQTLTAMGVAFSDSAQDNTYLVSIVDEAHALINTEHQDGYGQFGFDVNLGPQAYHIMRVSQVTIFLLDPEQSFRDRESTSIENIQQWAKDLGAELIETVSLEGTQFRCAGSSEYVAWVEAMLHGTEVGACQALSKSWHAEIQKTTAVDLDGYQGIDSSLAADLQPGFEILKDVLEPPGTLDFGLHENPFQLEETLRRKIDLGYSARLFCSYSRPWPTKSMASPHNLPANQKDFCEEIEIGNSNRVWSKVWNHVPQNNYALFVQGIGPAMANDPLSEVGCPYVIRGFDFDYVGIVWLEDLVWRHDRWVVQMEHVHESGLVPSLRRARNEVDPEGPAHESLRTSILQAYRILFTRAMRGVYVWIKDEETRRHVSACLDQT